MCCSSSVPPLSLSLTIFLTRSCSPPALLASDSSLIKLSASGYGFTVPFRSVQSHSHSLCICFPLLLALPLCGRAHTAFPLSTEPRQPEVSFESSFYLYLPFVVIVSQQQLQQHTSLADCTPGTFSFIIGTNFVSSLKSNQRIFSGSSQRLSNQILPFA